MEGEGIEDSKGRDSAAGNELDLPAGSGSGASSRDRSPSRSPLRTEGYEHQQSYGSYGDEFPLEDDTRVEFRPIRVGVCAMEAKVKYLLLM